MWIVESSLDSPVQSGKNFSVSSTAGGNGNFLLEKNVDEETIQTKMKMK
jgi:hypothetical protein